MPRGELYSPFANSRCGAFGSSEMLALDFVDFDNFLDGICLPSGVYFIDYCDYFGMPNYCCEASNHHVQCGCLEIHFDKGLLLIYS